jgi:glycosyltransferase involved in cell wall biosynthesis
VVPPTPSVLAVATDRTGTPERRADAIDRPTGPARPLTVLIAAPTLDAGAADEGAVELARILASAGHHPIIVSLGGRLEGEIARIGATFVKLDTTSQNPFVIARNAVALRRIVRDRVCDVVHAHGRASAWSAWLSARLCGVPFLTTCYTAFREQNILKRWYNAVMARGDRVITVSDQIAELLVDRSGVPWDRISVIRTPLDLAPFDPGLMTAERIAGVRDAWGVTNDTCVILVPGRIIRRRGHHVTVQAAARLKAKGLRDFLFVFAGDDEGRSRYSGELWDLVLATNTADVIRIAGPLADRPACYAAATVVLSAAIQLEGPQRGMLEAMAMARPIIASHLAAGPEALLAPPLVTEERMTGLRFPAGDEAALAAALIRMLSYPEADRHAMGARARAFVLAEFDRARSAEQMLAIYANVSGAIGKSRGPISQAAVGEPERR